MIFLVPVDLSASLGHMGEPDHPDVRRKIAAVEAAAKAAGCLLGGIPTPERSAKDLYAAGYDLVLGEIDVVLLREGARLGAAALREAAGRRSEEHTSELQSIMRISYAVFCLKKKNRHILIN